MNKRKCGLLAIVLTVAMLSSCNSTASEEQSGTMAIHEIVQSAVSTLSNTDTVATTTAETTIDPWVAARENIFETDTTKPVIKPGFSSDITFFEASSACSLLDIDYYNDSNVQIGRGIFIVYPNEDDFDINFRVRLLNKDRFKYILEATPYIPQSMDYYKLTYDSEAEFPYEYQFQAYKWHLTSFPSLASIKAWARAWYNGESAEPFFTLTPAADAYFKQLGSDSQLPASERYAAYAAKFSDEDPYFIDRVTGIKYQFGVNEAAFSPDNAMVGIPYLRVCDLMDKQDLYCDLYYSYNGSAYDIVLEDWTQDSTDLDVSGVLKEEIEEGESIFGYIIMPYNGSGIYSFKGRHGDNVSFKIYNSVTDLTSMQQCVQDYMTVNPAASVDYETLLSTSSAIVNTSSSANAKNKLYTVADMTALRNYYLFVQSYTDSNIWIQLSSNNHFLWRVDANTAYVYHIAEDGGDPNYMLVGDAAWVVLARSLFSDTSCVDKHNGAIGFLQWFNQVCNTHIVFESVS